jgi:hypothetical protein
METLSKISPADLVRKHFPDADNAEIEHILWNETAFGVCSFEHLEMQVKELADKVKGKNYDTK